MSLMHRKCLSKWLRKNAIARVNCFCLLALVRNEFAAHGSLGFADGQLSQAFMAVIKMKSAGPVQRSEYSMIRFAQLMFHKGKHFFGASVLLEEKKGYHDVVLHLQCQALEILQKGLLLGQDYERYQPQLKKMGHDLIRSSNELIAAYKLKPLKAQVRKELEQLNLYYMRQSLRYASIENEYGGTGHLQYELIRKRILHLIKFGDKVLEAKRKRLDKSI